MENTNIVVHPIYGPIECTVRDGMFYDPETDTWNELCVKSIYKVKSQLWNGIKIKYPASAGIVDIIH